LVWLYVPNINGVTKKKHTSENVIKSLHFTPPIPDIGWKEPPQAMPDDYKDKDPVIVYRTFIVQKNLDLQPGLEGLSPNLCNSTLRFNIIVHS